MRLMTWKRAIDYAIEYEGGKITSQYTYLSRSGNVLMYNVGYEMSDTKYLETYKITRGSIELVELED